MNAGKVLGVLSGILKDRHPSITLLIRAADIHGNGTIHENKEHILANELH
jgi:hypothetical protein